MSTASGLDQVVAAETRLSHVDGEKGELIVAGWPLEALVQHFDYASAAALLWQPFLPEVGPESLKQAFGQARVLAWNELKPYAAKLKALPALEALRLGLDLTADDPQLGSPTGICASLLVGFALQAGSEIPPDAQAEPVTDLMRMLGTSDAAKVRALTRYLVTVCDHGLNASTFTARVIASTASDARSAVVGAIGALKGPLHGGAPGPVLDMLDAIGGPERAESWIQAELAAGRRIMGFGHRIYRVRDPRADVLKATVEQLLSAGEQPGLQAATGIETIIRGVLRRHKPDRVLDTNVEFYTALLLDALGFEREAFTAVFALGRALGWIAHALEQQATGRLIRPQSVYVGPPAAPADGR